MAMYQLTWKILPGLQGLACSEFRAAPAARDLALHDGIVVVELASEAEREALVRELEQHFAGQRFSNGATAFETVKAHVLERCKMKNQRKAES